VKPGVHLLADTPGTGAPVERHKRYDVRLQMWLSRRDPVRWTEPWGAIDGARLENEGATLVTTLRIDRKSMIDGLFYGVEGMRVGGRRRLRVAPHLAYRQVGVPGVIPSNALLTIEIEVRAERVA
jgi:hypothetical protein